MNMNKELVIDDLNFKESMSPLVNGKQSRRGLVPRDLERQPVGSFSSGIPFSKDIPLIPRAEWSERIQELEVKKMRLSDLRMQANAGKRIPSLDQNGQGFCWAYSTVMAVMILRAVANQRYVRLSPHAVACKIFDFMDQGGWGCLLYTSPSPRD